MAYEITSKCYSCYGCETVCLAGAIKVEGTRFTIDPSICNECESEPDPQPKQRCLAICPEPGAIVQALAK